MNWFRKRVECDLIERGFVLAGEQWVKADGLAEALKVGTFNHPDTGERVTVSDFTVVLDGGGVKTTREYCEERWFKRKGR